MATYGVTASGFVKKPLSVIRAEIEGDLRTAWGESFDLSTESPGGQLVGIMADREADIWDKLQEVYAAGSPAGATGMSLVNVCALTGTKPLPATPSKVTARLTGTPAASISAATFSVQGTGAQFKMDADAVIGGGGTVDVPCTAVLTGPTICAAGTLTVIDTPRAGLTSVTNPADESTLGRALETDAELRVRRESELRQGGAAALEPIREAVLALEDADGNKLVSSCTVFENVEDVTDTDGVPPHAINVLATCATGSDIDAAVAGAIYQTKAAGIKAHGTTVVSVTDSEGNAHSIGFDRPTELDVYARIDLLADARYWPIDGDAQVKAAVVAYGLAALVTGKDVVPSAVGAQAFKVAGVLDAPPAKLSLAPSPTTAATIPVSARQIAKLDTSRVTVFVSFGTP